MHCIYQQKRVAYINKTTAFINKKLFYGNKQWFNVHVSTKNKIISAGAKGSWVCKMWGSQSVDSFELRKACRL